MAQSFRLRRGTAAEWTAANPVLAQGEPGYETDTGYMRIGDGVTAWTGLPTTTIGTALNDASMRTVDADAASQFRVQQDARHANTYATKVSLTTKLSSTEAPISPERYGTIGDGVADDTIALQTAIDAAVPGGEVWLSKTYKITAPLQLPSFVHLRGTPGAKIVQATSGQPGIISKAYKASNAISPTGHAKISGLTIQVPAATGSHGIILFDYYSVISDVEVQGGDRGIFLTHKNDAGTAAGGTLVENRIVDTKVTGFIGYGFYLGDTDNQKLTDGYLIDCLASGAAGSTSHVLIGASAGWKVDGLHTYGQVTGHSVQCHAAQHLSIDNYYIETFGASGAGIALTSAQRAVNVGSGSMKFPNSASTLGGLYVSRSSGYSSLDVSVDTLHAVQLYDHPATVINVASGSTIVHLGVMTKSGSFPSRLASKTGSGQIITKVNTTAVELSAPNMSVVTGATMSQVAGSGVLGWLMDPNVAESIAGMVRLPDHWDTFNMAVQWAPTDASAGSVRWDYALSFPTVGQTLFTTYTGVTAGSTAPGVAGQLVSYTLATGLVNQPGKKFAFRVIRGATDATYDTYPADAGVIAVVFTQAS